MKAGRDHSALPDLTAGAVAIGVALAVLAITACLAGGAVLHRLDLARAAAGRAIAEAAYLRTQLQVERDALAEQLSCVRESVGAAHDRIDYHRFVVAIMARTIPGRARPPEPYQEPEVKTCAYPTSRRR